MRIIPASTYASDDIVDVRVASQICGLSVATLNKYRVVGGGPEFLKYSRLIRYRVGDLRTWMERGRRGSTAEYGVSSTKKSA